MDKEKKNPVADTRLINAVKANDDSDVENLVDAKEKELNGCIAELKGYANALDGGGDTALVWAVRFDAASTVKRSKMYNSELVDKVVYRLKRYNLGDVLGEELGVDAPINMFWRKVEIDVNRDEINDKKSEVDEIIKAFMDAVRRNLRIIDILLFRCFANVDVQLSNNANNPLILAVRANRLDVVWRLLACRQKLNAKNEIDKKIISLARLCSKPVIRMYLEENIEKEDEQPSPPESKT